MATIEEQVKNINEQRLKVWERGKAILDDALSEGRTLNAEESENYDKVTQDIARYDNTRDALLSSDKAQREIENVNEEFRRVSTPLEVTDHKSKDQQELESFFRREIRSPGLGELEIDMRVPARAYEAYRMGARGNEFRVLMGDSGASGGSLTIPTTVASTVYAFMTASVAMRRMNTTIITTSGGNPMNFPRVGTHGIATQIATQNTTIAGADPVLTMMTLQAWDIGQLIPVANDLLQDSGVDLLGFVGGQIGRGLGQLSATWYVAGTGSSQPTGVMTAIGGAGTVATGGSLLLGPAGQVLEKLIDVQYSVVDSYRNNGASWLMRDLTGAVIRKIRDGAGGTAGQFVWQPSPTVGLIGGQPDTFLGDPVYFDPNVASMASDAKVIAYGDFSSYYIRDVGSLRLERSDDAFFAQNQVAFRGILRTDGNLIDSHAVNCLHQAVT